ncbi:MAG: hypothetical protein ACTSQY_00680 [Candidatus Odinarchaeia archaeon]
MQEEKIKCPKQSKLNPWVSISKCKTCLECISLEEYNKLTQDESKRDENQKYGKHNAFGTSALTKCLRQQYFRRKLGSRLDWETKKKFFIGTEAHNFLQDLIGSQVNIEDRFCNKLEDNRDWASTGFIDINNKGNEIIELKCLATTRFVPQTPYDSHIEQVKVYCINEGVTKAKIIYFKVFDLEFDQKELAEFKADMIKQGDILYSSLKNNEIPLATACKVWECNYCQYRQECENIDSYSADLEHKENEAKLTLKAKKNKKKKQAIANTEKMKAKSEEIKNKIKTGGN